MHVKQRFQICHYIRRMLFERLVERAGREGALSGFLGNETRHTTWRSLGDGAPWADPRSLPAQHGCINRWKQYSRAGLQQLRPWSLSDTDDRSGKQWTHCAAERIGVIPLVSGYQSARERLSLSKTRTGQVWITWQARRSAGVLMGCELREALCGLNMRAIHTLSTRLKPSCLFCTTSQVEIYSQELLILVNVSTLWQQFKLFYLIPQNIYWIQQLFF